MYYISVLTFKSCQVYFTIHITYLNKEIQSQYKYYTIYLPKEKTYRNIKCRNIEALL